MKKLLAIMFVLMLSGMALAIPTDGNYTLLQHNLDGGGTYGVDANMTVYAAAGESITQQNTSDDNFALAVGYYGEPFSAIAAAVEEAIRKIYIIVTENYMTVVPLFALIAIAVASITYMFYRKKQKQEVEINA